MDRMRESSYKEEILGGILKRNVVPLAGESMIPGLQLRRNLGSRQSSATSFQGELGGVQWNLKKAEYCLYSWREWTVKGQIA